MKIKLKWHKFLCWLFGHRWYYREEEIKGQFNPDLWRICKRCAESELLKSKPIEFPIKLIIIAVLIFFSGYFLRSIHYRQDLPRIEKAQVEIRLDHQKIKEGFKPVIESAIKTLQEYEEIIEWNQAHPVVAFIEMEEK